MHKKPVYKGIIKGVSLLLSDNDTRKIQMLRKCTDIERICSKDGKRFWQEFLSMKVEN